jgi:N-methylhydantoinase A
MQSSGGVVPVAQAARHAAACLKSGPAGGVVGAAWVAGLSGEAELLTFDMGGTSTDVAAVRGGAAQVTTESVVAGVPIKLPMVDVHSVSAGGGSIAWMDEGGALRVGPSSAGADPGPAAYGRGGTEPTVTDANLLLGYLAPGMELGGEVRLDRDLAERALARLGERLALDPLAVARGVVEVANAEMVRALRVISVERGLDPREFTLVAFGGAGGLHALTLAEELGIGRVLAPQASGVLSALGLAISDLRRDQVRPLLGPLDQVDPAAVEAAWVAMEADARADLLGRGGTRPAGPQPAFERRADLRYHGQSFELPVPADELDGLAGRFHVEHERRYGFRMDGEPVELVHLRLVATLPGEKPEPVAGPPAAPRSWPRRGIHLDGAWQDAAVVAGTDLGEGSRVDGPAVVELAGATVLVRGGWRGQVDRVGTLVLEREPRP